MSSKKEVFIFIGPPGAGKGSLAKLCIKFNGWEQLSTGNLCRKHIAEQTEIGKKIDFAIKSGKLISDDLVTQMVENWLDNNIDKASAVIFDGYPRTVEQAQGLNALLEAKFKDLNLRIVRLVASDDTVTNRLFSRYVCINKDCQAVYSSVANSSFAPKKEWQCDRCEQQLIRRSDDEKEAIFKRLHVYHKHEQTLLSFYRDAGYQILEFNVEKPLIKIFDEFKQHIGVEVI